MSKETEAILKLEALVKRAERFQPFFESELFKEWNGILSKKIDSYRTLLNKAPRVGDVKVMEQVTESKEGKTLTKVPFRITKEEQDEIIGEYMHRINELQLVVDMPMLMKKDAEQMKAEIERLNKIIKES